MLWTIMIRKAVAIVMLIGFSMFTLVSCASERYQQNKGAAIGGGAGAAAGGGGGGGRGGTIDLSTPYTVLGPQGATMEVTETREIRHKGELTGKPQVTVQRQGGTYTSRGPLTLTAGPKK